MMKTVLLDVDEVLVDCCTPVHKRAQRYFNRELPNPNVAETCEFTEALGLTAQDWKDFEWDLRRENILGYLVDWYPGAEDFVHELTKFCKVHFVTAHWKGLPCWVPARDALLGRAFPDLPVTYTHHKELVSGDFLLDDRPKNIIANKNRAIVWDRTWNRHLFDVPRVNSYEKATNYLRMLCT